MNSWFFQTLTVPAEKLTETESLFRQWQDQCRNVELKEPSMRISEGPYISPPPGKTSGKVLQATLEIKAHHPVLKKGVVKGSNATAAECDFCFMQVPAKRGWLVQRPDKSQVACCTHCAGAAGDTVTKQLRVLNTGRALFLPGPRWNTVYDMETQRKCAGRYVSTAGFLSLAEQITQRNGFVKSDQPDSTRDIILMALKDPAATRIAWLEGIHDAIHYHTDDTLRERYLQRFSQSQKKSGYIALAQEALSRPYIDLNNTNHTGVAASLPNALANHFGHTPPPPPTAPEPGPVSPVGNPKERGSLLLTLTRRKPQPDREYPTVAYYFVDTKGRQYEWYASDSVVVNLNPGERAILTATIKKHRERGDGSIVTTLTRCADITSATADTPEPDFSAGVKARAFKEIIECQVLAHGEGEHIDGQCYLHFQRHWKQGGSIHQFKDCRPISDSDALVETLGKKMQEISGKAGTEKQNKRWRDAVVTALAPYLTPHALPDTLFVVDDATGTPFSEHAEFDSVFTRVIQRTPHPVMFSSLPPATDYSRRYAFSRILTIRWPSPTILRVPSEAKHYTEKQHQALCQAARDRGVDILAYYDTECSRLTRLLPLSLKQADNNSDITLLRQVLGQYKRERGLTTKLEGFRLLAISGCQKQRDATSLLTTLRENEYALQRQGVDTRWLDNADGLAGLKDVLSFPRGTARPLLVVMEATTVCAMSQLGAHVTQLHISDTPTECMVKSGRRLPPSTWSIAQIKE